MKHHLNSKVNHILNQNIFRRERLERVIRENLDKKLILVIRGQGDRDVVEN